jgi:SAM-dependent methyltransferase
VSQFSGKNKEPFMKQIERAVAQHYGNADLLTRILDGLKAVGADLEHLQADDLAPVDEFHIGGRQATVHALEKMALDERQRVLDIGCGIGGATRYIAAAFGCYVTGIDLTADYIAVAQTLTRMTGLNHKAKFYTASALDMPFEPATFDAAITFHVAMNIPDRAALYVEIARVLKPGASLCIYDLMTKGAGPLAFPVPWAETPATSHLVSPEDMHGLLADAGLTVESIQDRTPFALDFFRQSLAAAPASPPPLGLHLVMGPTAREKFTNVLTNIEAGRIAPVLMTARREK